MKRCQNPALFVMYLLRDHLIVLEVAIISSWGFIQVFICINQLNKLLNKI